MPVDNGPSTWALDTYVGVFLESLSPGVSLAQQPQLLQIFKKRTIRGPRLGLPSCSEPRFQPPRTRGGHRWACLSSRGCSLHGESTERGSLENRAVPGPTHCQYCAVDGIGQGATFGLLGLKLPAACWLLAGARLRPSSCTESRFQPP